MKEKREIKHSKNRASMRYHQKKLKDGWTERKEFWMKKEQYGTWLVGKKNTTASVQQKVSE